MITDRIYSYLNGEGVTIDEALRYEVVTIPTAMMKSLRYAVRPSISIAKSLQYVVLRNMYTRRNDYIRLN